MVKTVAGRAVWPRRLPTVPRSRCCRLWPEAEKVAGMSSGPSWTRGTESSVPGQRRGDEDGWASTDAHADPGEQRDGPPKQRGRWRGRGKANRGAQAEAEPEPLDEEESQYWSYLRGDDEQ